MATAQRQRVVAFGDFSLDLEDERLIGSHGPIRIGHKAFRVLSALVDHSGVLLTKEELLDIAWDGAAVSESALTTVIKELRRALGDESRSPRYIESVYGRGYRFLAATGAVVVPLRRNEASPPIAPSPDPVPQKASAFSRRGLLFALGLTGAAAIGGGAFVLTRGPGRPAEVEALLRQSTQLMGQNTLEAQNQAIGLLRRAVAIVPRDADAWGMLGMAYAIPSHYRERHLAMSMRQRAMAAGQKALQLDSDNMFGELALGIAEPFVGDYGARHRHFARALALQPDNEDALTYNAVTLQFVGLAAEAVPLYERIRQRPLTPAAYNNYIQALWSAGRLDEMDAALADAAALYPTQGSLWYARFNLANFTGRPMAALALLDDRDAWPSSVTESDRRNMQLQTRALADPSGAEAATLVSQQLEYARKAASGAETAIRLLAALGHSDQAFETADAYYFNRGFAVPDYPMPGSASSPEQRQTRFLFEPVTAPLRADPRFENLVRELGFDRFWRNAGLVPDYRKA